MLETHLGDASQWRARLDEAVGGVTQLLDLLVCERVNPSIRVVLVVLLLPHCHTGNLLGKLRVGEELAFDGRVLSRGSNAVWEDIAGSLVVLHLHRGGGEVGRLVNERSWCHDDDGDSAVSEGILEIGGLFSESSVIKVDVVHRQKLMTGTRYNSLKRWISNPNGR